MGGPGVWEKVDLRTIYPATLLGCKKINTGMLYTLVLSIEIATIPHGSGRVGPHSGRLPRLANTSGDQGHPLAALDVALHALDPQEGVLDPRPIVGVHTEGETRPVDIIDTPGSGSVSSTLKVSGLYSVLGIPVTVSEHPIFALNARLYFLCINMFSFWIKILDKYLTLSPAPIVDIKVI
jgi:hypothetical protein